MTQNIELDKFTDWMQEFPEINEAWNELPVFIKTIFEAQIQNYAQEQILKNIHAFTKNVNSELKKDTIGIAVEECKCIRFTGGDKWYSNGCTIHPNG